MKVKCRGFKGNLISIKPITEIQNISEAYSTYFYEIEIQISKKQQITISDITDEDIEFIKE